MRRCLDLARQGAGAVSPNPMVGAVLVAPDGTVLGEGHHAHYGGPHAEANAVADARTRHGSDALRSATLYVNLEPCTHHGKTPPCTDLVLETGIPRLVVGTVDPFPAMKGAGIQRLRDAGVAVEVGVLQARCRRLNEAFLHHVHTGRPLVTLKVAQTLDGRIATRTGDSRWISGDAARTMVHRWRAEQDAVLVGSGTARSDDPRLTVRHVDGPQPVRLVLDRAGSLPPTLHLFSDAHAAYTRAVIGADRPRPPYADALDAAGGHLLRLPETDTGHLDLSALLHHLGTAPVRTAPLPNGTSEAAPLQSLFVEAGPGLATALWKHDLVDRYFCFVAPKVLGTGTPSVADLGVSAMNAARTFADHTWETVGDDLLFRGYLRAV